MSAWKSNARQSSCWKVEALCKDGGIMSGENILKVDVYVTSVEMFPAVN
jgi:enamine deaminase RidA (YjgF/YER057c/UK114 family)